MGVEFFDFPNAAPLNDANDLGIPRARHIAAAIATQGDFTIASTLRHAMGSEIIIVDVVTDAVPPNNPVGIRYRERVALYGPKDVKSLVEVRMLRKDFPVLPHQNSVPSGAPLSLCLYFGPPASVLRTWTPQSFLRRIQGWLEK